MATVVLFDPRVSTLLEILHASGQPKRSYISDSMFQPFLRFYRPSKRVGKCCQWCKLFQPFLRFYGSTLRVAPYEAGVSTLLEILPLMCLVVVGF